MIAHVQLDADYVRDLARGRHPIIFLYLRAKWPLRAAVFFLLTIPLFGYLTYALLHESGHIAGTLLIGGKIVDYKLIPRFWLGEFGWAWITSEAITQVWHQLITTTFPYILDALCIITAIFVLRRDFSKNSFVVGFVFKILSILAMKKRSHISLI